MKSEDEIAGDSIVHGIRRVIRTKRNIKSAERKTLRKREHFQRLVQECRDEILLARRARRQRKQLNTRSQRP